MTGGPSTLEPAATIIGSCIGAAGAFISLIVLMCKYRYRQMKKAERERRADAVRVENERVRAADQAVAALAATVLPATESSDPIPSPSAPSFGAYIPEAQRVHMQTSHGICSILSDVDEVLYRPSLDCNHFIGAAALRQYLKGSVRTGPFPIRCPVCRASNPSTTGRIVTEGPLCSLVAAGVITAELSRRILISHIRLDSDQATLEVLYTTTKQCPFCSIRISHYRGHACHHISPSGGCTSCQNHFCYNCLGYRGDGVEWQGCPNGCAPFCTDGCSCPDCPDCQPGVPCDHCSYPNMRECRVCTNPQNFNRS